MRVPALRISQQLSAKKKHTDAGLSMSSMQMTPTDALFLADIRCV